LCSTLAVSKVEPFHIAEAVFIAVKLKVVTAVVVLVLVVVVVYYHLPIRYLFYVV